MKRNFFASLLIGLALVLASASPATAIENQGVGGKPANPRADNPRTKSIFIYELGAGESAKDGVLIANNTDKKQTIEIYPVDSLLSSGGAFACKQKVESRQDVGAWIKLDQDSVTLEPNSTKTVPFTITVPSKVDVGEHDGCIAIQADSRASDSSDAGVQLSFRSAIRVVVTVPGEIVKKLSITDVAVETGKETLIVSPTVHNDGNVSLDTKITIDVTALLGGVDSTTDTGNSPVLPGSDANWRYEVPKPFWGGFYTAKVTASYNNNPDTQLGSDMTNDRESKQLSSAVFFVAPSPLASLIELLGLALVIAAVYWFVRGRKHASHVKKTWKSYTVKDGDTLHKLATARGTSWKRIAKVNKIKAPYHLEAGQKIKLPPAKE